MFLFSHFTRILLAGLLAGVAAGGLRAAPAAAIARKPAPVVVIHGRRSLAGESDRSFALSLSRHAVRWFREGGLEADLRSDEKLAADLRGRQVAMLNHCAQPQPDQLRELRAFVARGGTLIVCYSASPGLADLMGVRLGTYLKADAGQFSAMRFEPRKPVNTPRQIAQSSPNILPAAVIEGRSTVLAWWVDRQGGPSGQAAWLQGAAGFWMTHILTADGDAAEKGRLLVALAADRHPALWRDAAAARLKRVLAGAPWTGQEEARHQARALPGGKRREAALAAVEQAYGGGREARRLLDAGRGAEAWLVADETGGRMMEAYGLMQAPQAGEIRAVWDHSGQGLYPGDWPRTCRVLKDAGISDLLVNVAAPGFAHCRLDALPRSPVYESQGDQLAACLAAARPLGLRVHAWMIAFSTTHATPYRMQVFSQRGWLLQATDGTYAPWLDPAVPEVRAMLVQAAGEILARYRVDGIHLDFVRYPDYYGSLGEGVRRRFEASRGRKIADWPEAARRQPLFNELVRWRGAQTTALVAEIRRLQRRVAPGTWLTAAVLGKYPTCVESVGQDWDGWIEQGYLDYVLPMNYTEQRDAFDALVAQQTRSRRQATRLVGGIGVTASESRLDAAGVIDQVNLLRSRDAAGFALFDLDATLAREILPVLRLGLTAPTTKNGP